jgi:hypothetical protein
VKKTDREKKKSLRYEEEKIFEEKRKNNKRILVQIFKNIESTFFTIKIVFIGFMFLKFLVSI